MNRVVLAVVLSTCIAGPLAAAEVRYITDEFEITMRSGTSTANNIVRMLQSGEAVTVLEQDLVSKYSLVETEDNKKGYVLSRFLMEQPAARQSLRELNISYERQRNRISEQEGEISALKQSLAQEQSDNQALKKTLRASEQELAEVRGAAENTLNILEQNKRLETVLEQLKQEKAQLTDINAELNDSTRLDWFVRGGAVCLIAFLVGIVVTRIRWRKQDSWGSY